MAREEHPREDLLRDARNLTPRAQLRVPGVSATEPVFCGFRGDALSVYVGEDPAYHFNAAGEFRRGYVAGRLIKAEAGVLFAMTRQRTASETQLATRELAAEEADALLAAMQACLQELAQALEAGKFEVQGQVPADADLVPQLTAWLSRRHAIAIAASPRVGV